MQNKVLKYLHSFYSALIDFIYPPVCLLCDEYLDQNERLVCEQCWNNLPRLDQKLPENQTAPALNESAALKRIVSLWEFSDAVHRVIYEMKYFRKKSIANRIGREIATIIANDAEISSADLIVPVPLHKTKFRERGFNQSHLIANVISCIFKIPVENGILQRIKRTKTQAKLNADERRKNVADAFKCVSGKGINNKTILIVDDVCTTGATINACAEVLRKHGCVKTIGLTAAKTLRHETIST